MAALLPSTRVRILYMEDDQALAQCVRRQLGRHGFDVGIVSDGLDGLELMKTDLYDIVILDYKMPTLDGMDVLKRIAADRRAPPVIMLSGAGDLDVAVEAMKEGAADYMVKDLDGNYLKLLPGMIQKILDKQILIQEKMAAEAALKASELQFRSVTHSAIDAIISGDSEGNVIFWNRGASLIFGYQEEEILGQPSTRLMPERYREAHLAALMRILATGKTRLSGQVVELYGLRRDGSEFPAEISLASWTINDGRFFSSIIRDVSERKQAEQRAREEGLFLKRVVNNMPGVFYLFDQKGSMLRWNQNFQEMMGYDGEEIRHTPILEFVPVDERPRFAAFIQKVFESGYGVTEGSLVGKAGQAIPFLLTGSRVEMGGEACLTGTGVDISERIVREEKMRRFLQTQTAINTLLKSATEPHALDRQIELALDLILSRSWFVSPKMGAIFLRDKTGNALFMKAHRGLSEPFRMHCQRISRGHCLCGRALEERAVLVEFSERVVRTCRQYGMEAHGYYCVPIVSRGNNLGLINVYVQDGHRSSAEQEAFLNSIANTLSGVIERTWLDEERHQAKVQAEQANAAKSRFLANMSHDIRTPMNAILGMGEVLQESGLNREQARLLQVLNHAGKTLLSLINDILDISKIEAGQLHVEACSFDLHDLTETTHQILQQTARVKGLAFPCRIRPDCPRIVVGDPKRLQQILLNLLNNAIKFTEQGAVSLTVDGGEQDFVRFTVEDTGIGIADSQMGHIFEPFSQAESTTSRRFGGTGLGLTICKQLVLIMGGDIEVTSTLGQGSTFVFTVRFPKSQDSIADHRFSSVSPSENRQDEQGQSTRSMVKAPARTILLVDDADDNRFLVTMFLRRLPYRVTEAVNGKEAVHLFQSGAFDVVLMDMQMPVLDGFEATRQIRAWEKAHRRAPTPIIACTADAVLEDVERTQAVGCDDYLSKPFGKARLIELINKWG